jgi:2-hydroxyacyl-CoA lyase 1
MAKLIGGDIMARALKDQGVEYMFGIVGFPVHPIARGAQKVGIKFYGCRNEQAGLLCGRGRRLHDGPAWRRSRGIGPGVVHGLSGLSNAKENCWPMILIGGASPVRQNGMGAFQEERQVLIATPFCKFAHAIESPAAFRFMSKWRAQFHLRPPGACYLDMPDDIILGEEEEDKIQFPGRCADPPRIAAPQEYIDQAIKVLRTAKRRW